MITPYIENHDRMSLGVYEVQMRKNIAGWLSVYVAWNCDNWRRKYPKFEGSGGGFGAGDNSEFINLSFPKSRLYLEIGIRSEHSLNYRYKYFDNLKYSVCVYFAPTKFDLLKDKILYSWLGKDTSKKGTCNLYKNLLNQAIQEKQEIK